MSQKMMILTQKIGAVFFCLIGIALATSGLVFGIIKSDLLLGTFVILCGMLTMLFGVFTYQEASK